MDSVTSSLVNTGPKVINGTRLRIGTTSWTDRSLTHESDWYPRRSMKAAERIAFYSERFSLVEMDNTYRFPPTNDVANQWVERTPDGFSFDLQLWSLLTGQAAMPASLWADLGKEVKPERRDQPRLYITHLSTEAVDECWARVLHAIEPLRAAGRLGTLVLRYPRWFGPSDRNHKTLAETRSRLGDIPAAVQFASDDWTAGDVCEDTLSFLDELDFAFVNVDCTPTERRPNPELTATSCDVGYLKLLGRQTFDEESWSPDMRGYRYDDNELHEIALRVVHLLDCTSELHVVVSTPWRDDSVVNAEHLTEAIEKAAKT